MPDANNDNDAITNIKNVLGFLLAGFGAALSFLGIRSSEVTTILRNDAWQASLIAFILLTGVLIAIWAIITKSEKQVYTLTAIAVTVFVLGVGALVIFFIPIGSSPFTIPGIISLAIGCVLLLAGTTALVRRSVWAGTDDDEQHGQDGDRHDEDGERRSQDSEKHARWRRLLRQSATRQEVDLISILIVVSVLLTGIATYGAMRLESKSQLSFTSQVGASFSVNGPNATVSVDVAATKLPQNDYVFVDVYAVPVGINLTNACTNYYLTQYAHHVLPKNFDALVDHCITDPCLYFNGQPSVCSVVLNGTINPDATGDVSKTLSVPFKIAGYQDMDVRAEVCSLNPNESCEGSSGGENSRLDWVISNSQITPAN